MTRPARPLWSAPTCCSRCSASCRGSPTADPRPARPAQEGHSDMTASLAQTKTAAEAARPITMFGPDFPFAYDDHLAHPAGLGRVPAERHGTEVAIIGAGIAGLA